MPAYNIDIMACINRSVYILDVDRVLLISHLNVDESSYLLGVVIKGHGIGEFEGKKYSHLQQPPFPTLYKIRLNQNSEDLLSSSTRT